MDIFPRISIGKNYIKSSGECYSNNQKCPPQTGDYKFRKSERIKKKSEFQKIAQHGIRYSTQNFIVIIFQRNTGESRRLGISVSKKVGGAVKRNRVKRLLREFFRLNKDNLPESLDLLFIAKPGAASLNYSSLSGEMLEFFKNIHI